MHVQRLLRLVLLVAGALALAGCSALDTEDEARAMAVRWVFLAQTQAFVSNRDCTVARFDVISPELRRSGGAERVNSVRAAIAPLQSGEVVAFEIPGVTPNEVSEQLMSINLFKGLGMLSSFIGPGRRCMDDAFAAQAFAALMSEDTVLVYDPVHYALLLLHRPTLSAFFMRTKS